MISYYCIVNLPGVPAREIAALDASDDAAACAALANLAERRPGFETITLHQDERLVRVVGNPALGFTPDPLEIRDQAA